VAPKRWLRLHGWMPFSRANGPGLRSVIWLQGCSLGCPGCFNPQTHSVRGGEKVLPGQLAQRILSLGLQTEGLTISGGEPFQQPAALSDLLAELRRASNLSIVVFSGYEWDELQQFPYSSRLLEQIDVLISGRYDASRRLAHSLLGSVNKTIHLLTERYQASDLLDIPPAEVVIGPDGEIILSGIDPLDSAAWF